MRLNTISINTIAMICLLFCSTNTVVAGDEPEAKTKPGDAQKLSEKWSYDRLVKESDLVVIGKYQSSRPIKLTKRDQESEGWFKEAVGIESQFAVLTDLKSSEIEKVQRESVSMIHFAREGVFYGLSHQVFLEFSPPTFDTDYIIIVTTKGNYRSHYGEYRRIDQHWKYLLFLKDRGDGNYEPVSGHLSPHFSVIRLGD